MSDSTGFVEAMQRNRYGPQWRWLAAQDAASTQSGKFAGYHDSLTKLAADVLSQRSGRRIRRTAQEIELIEAAESIEVDVGMCETLQILAIGDVELHHIAELSGVPLDNIRTWEGLFFDVRECRKRLAWIRGKVIRPFEEAGKTTFASRLKVALAGGAATAKLVIESDVQIPVEEADRVVDAERKLHQKLVEAADISLVGSADAVKLLTAQMDRCLAVKQLEFEREKFREHCEAEVRRHELATQRLEDPGRLLAAVSNDGATLAKDE